MASLKFNRLLVKSDSTKSGNLFEFSPKLNLISANDNTVGKSTLVKVIFWTLGCEPSLDTTWNSLDCKAILEFSVGNKEYKVQRYKSRISIVIEDAVFEFEKISGKYSEILAGILNFKALLPNRKNDTIEVPPPAFYFLPYYIDQKRSWSTAWDNFEKLGQYSNWKSTIVQYHVGLLSPEYFDFTKEIYSNKELNKQLTVEIEKLETALEVVHNFVPENNTTLVEADFIAMTDDVKNRLGKLGKEQECLLEDIAIEESNYTYLHQQSVLSRKIIQELDSDYKFSIENISDDEIECPLCGVVHDNSIVNRASILTDKQQAENQLNEIESAKAKSKRKLHSFKIKVVQLRNEINEINERYSVENESDGERFEFNAMVEQFAVSSIGSRVTETKNENIIKHEAIETANKNLEKDQKKLISAEHKETINNSFTAILSSYVKKLDAEGVNLAEINKPTDGSKIVKEGGAAEGTRGILAYYLTIYSLIEEYGNEVVSPLVIDTPNQQEQSLSNYDKIVDILTGDLPKDSQIIVCAMENEQLEPYAKLAKVITLDSSRILQKDEYEVVQEGFKEFGD